MKQIRNVRVDGDFNYYQDSHNYDENIQHLRGDTYYYTCWNQISIDSIEDLFEISLDNRKGKLLHWLRDTHGYNDFSWAKNINDVITEIFDNYSMKTLSDFIYDLELYNIKHTKKFERIVSTGHFQGDSIEVFIPHKLKELWGTDDLNLNNLTEEIDNYCWNSQISGTFNISFIYTITRETFGDEITLTFDKEYEYNEWCNSEYELEIMVDAVISSIIKETRLSELDEGIVEIRAMLEGFDYNDIKY